MKTSSTSGKNESKLNISDAIDMCQQLHEVVTNFAKFDKKCFDTLVAGFIGRVDEDEFVDAILTLHTYFKNTTSLDDRCLAVLTVRVLETINSLAVIQAAVIKAEDRTPNPSLN